MIETIMGNPGVIDPRLWSTFGVSVKEDGAIGKFGTGLKYAIAVLVREGRSIKICSGGTEYVFSAEQSDFRGKEFQQITCNGQALPYTTHLGAHWELWQAYRELASNCLDEGGVIGQEGETTVYADFEGVSHDDVFLNKSRRLIASNGDVEVFAGESSHIYYRGIRAFDLKVRSLYTYNVINVDITEDRTIKYLHQIYSAISGIVISSVNCDFIRDFLLKTRYKFEEHLQFDFTSHTPTEECIGVVKQWKKQNCYMQQHMTSAVLSSAGTERPDECDMTDRQKMVLLKATEFLGKANMPVNYPVKMSTDLGTGALAMADRRDSVIYLSDKVMDQGVKQVASALLEECIHLSKGLDDCTYEMQTYLFDRIISLSEEIIGEVI